MTDPGMPNLPEDYESGDLFSEQDINRTNARVNDIEDDIADDVEPADLAAAIAAAIATRQPKFITGTVATAAATATKAVTLDPPYDTYTPVAGDWLLIKFTLGTSVSNATIAIGGTNVLITTPGGSSSGSNLTIAAAGYMLMFFDGTKLWSVASQAHVSTTITQAEIDAGTSTSGRIVTPALVAYIMKAARIGSGQTSGVATANADLHNQYNLRGLTVAVTIAAPTGTAVDGQTLVYNLKDNGTARAITWNAIFRAVGVTLPTTTTAGKNLYVTVRYNAGDLKWDVVDVRLEA